MRVDNPHNNGVAAEISRREFRARWPVDINQLDFKYEVMPNPTCEYRPPPGL